MWTPERVELWLISAERTLKALPDMELRYLRTPLRSRMPEVVLDSAAAYARALAELDVEGRLRAPDVKPTVPSPAENDAMEQVLIGVPKPGLNLNGETPWLSWLSFSRRRLVWNRVIGWEWWKITAVEKRSENCCMRWYRQALAHIGDELITLEGDTC